MAKSKMAEPAEDQAGPTATEVIREKLRGAGCLTLWTAHPRGSAFSITAYLTTGRRIILLQEYDAGNFSVYEEVSSAQADDVIRNGS